MLHRLKYVCASHAFDNLSSKAIIGFEANELPRKIREKRLSENIFPF